MCNRFLARHLVLSQHTAMSCVQNDSNVHLCRYSHHVPLSHIAAAVYIEGKHQDFSVGQAPSVGNKRPHKVRYVIDWLYCRILCCRQSLPGAFPHMRIMACYSEVCLGIFAVASGMQDKHLATAMPVQHVSVQLSAVSCCRDANREGGYRLWLQRSRVLPQPRRSAPLGLPSCHPSTTM